jgi:GTPase SAR1 family protein
VSHRNRFYIYQIELWKEQEGMLNKKIAICGMPMVGKTTLLYRISELTGGQNLTTKASETARFVSLETTKGEMTLQFIALSGTFLYSKDVIPQVLKDASLIVYVISAPFRQQQRGFFDEYTKYATDLRVSWADVPWIFVLNKIDLSSDNSLLDGIPSKFHDKIIRCIATQGVGVGQVWHSLLTELGSG